MNWESGIQKIVEHLVRIESPNGTGTGFLAFYNQSQTWCAIATAAHVVSNADEWQQPIRIRNDHGARFLSHDDRVMFIDRSSDSAVIFFLKEDLQLPQLPITLRPIGTPCGIGTEVGWIGYPVIDPNTACFFSGAISALKQDRRAYYIDGVGINGVSGGPVFHLPPSGPNDLEIIGAISDYFPNMASGQPWPGLVQARDVSHFHAIAQHVQSIEQANAARIKFEKTIPPSAGTASSGLGP